jgi:hypothetical protein
MKEELTKEQLEIILREIDLYKAKFPEASVTYDTEKRRINITYPLPENIWEIKNIKINNDGHFRNIKRRT